MLGGQRRDTRLNINSNAPHAQACLVISDKNADTRVGLLSGFSGGTSPPAIIYTHDLRFGFGRNFRTGQDFLEKMQIANDGNVDSGIACSYLTSDIDIAKMRASTYHHANCWFDPLVFRDGYPAQHERTTNVGNEFRTGVFPDAPTAGPPRHSPSRRLREANRRQSSFLFCGCPGLSPAPTEQSRTLTGRSS
jgi:hypothetical protein